MLFKWDYCPPLSGFLRSFTTSFKEKPADAWQRLLYASFWVSIAFFPIGYGFREVMPLLCLVFLVPYYKYAWRESVLRSLKPAWLFLCAAAMTLCGVAFSIHPWDSFLHAGMGVNKAYILPFIAMECVRDEKQVRNLIWAFAFACFWEGLDGVWQALTGYDFIMGYKPNTGRLTGSLGDYPVGNYIALAMLPAGGIWFILRQNQGVWTSLFLFIAVFLPAIFLFHGASARSSALALAGGAAVWILMARGWKTWRLVLWPASIVAIFLFLQPERFSPQQVLEDNRWDLWRIGWKVFESHPWFGAGAGQYNAAFREMGLAPQREVITISHPHDVYLDILYAHGLIGFSLGMVFLFGFLIWGMRRLIPPLRAEIKSGNKDIYWRLSSCLSLGYAAWLINGIFGHDFYRIWWLAMAMTSLGLMCGVIINGERRQVSGLTHSKAE